MEEDNPEIFDVKVGKYKFRIKRIKRERDGITFLHSLYIEGKNIKCAEAIIHYEDNQPVSAFMPKILQDSSCSIDSPMDNGEGTRLMIHTLLYFIRYFYPTLIEIGLDDTSTIPCKMFNGKEKDVSLSSFSIAFNGVTWYEKYFKARLKNAMLFEAYRQRVTWLLTMPIPSFHEFNNIAKLPDAIKNELKTYFDNASTYGDFFLSIERNERCRLVGSWIETFMKYYLADYFLNYGWIIPLDFLFEKKGGSLKSRRQRKCKGKKRNVRKTVKINDTYYLPKCPVNLHAGSVFHHKLTFEDMF